MSRINVAEKGADPKGNTPIDDTINKHAAPNTELFFPEGTYLLDTFVSDHDNLQFRGDNATLVPTNRQSMSNWFELHSDGFLMAGFEWDMRECDYPPRFHLWGDNWTVKNIAVRGHVGTNGKNMDIHGVSFIRGWVTDENGTGTFQNIYLADGSGPPGARTNRRAFLIEGAEQRGTIVFDRVWLEQWGENTLYANNHPGRTVVKNSHFENTNVGLRLGGDSLVKNCTFVRDYSVPLQRQGWSGGALMRGIRVEGDDEWAYSGELRVTDCDFVFHIPNGDWSRAAGNGPWDSRPPLTWKAPCESVVIEDCRIRYDGYHGWCINRGDNLGWNDQNQSFLEVRNVDIDHRGWRGYGAVGLQHEPDELGELSGTISTTGNLCSASALDTDLTEGTPAEATQTPVMDSPPPIGQSPSYSEIPADARLLVIDASNSGRVEYKLSVSGKLWKVPEWGASVDVEDKHLGSMVDGWADNWLDAYRFTGEIQSATFSHPPALYLDGQAVAVDDLLPDSPIDRIEPKDPDEVSDEESETFVKTLYSFLYNYFLKLFK